jgi:hypothetical protein
MQFPILSAPLRLMGHLYVGLSAAPQQVKTWGQRASSPKSGIPGRNLTPPHLESSFSCCHLQHEAQPTGQKKPTALAFNTCAAFTDKIRSQAWWCTPVIQALGRQEDCEFQASLSYIVRHCLKTIQNKPGRGGWDCSSSLCVPILSHEASPGLWSRHELSWGPSGVSPFMLWIHFPSKGDFSLEELHCRRRNFPSFCMTSVRTDSLCPLNTYTLPEEPMQMHSHKTCQVVTKASGPAFGWCPFIHAFCFTHHQRECFIRQGIFTQFYWI